MLSLPLFSFRCRAKETRGIFPKSYVHLCEHNIVNGEYCIQRTDIVEEITKVMLEWGSIAKSYFLVSICMEDIACFVSKTKFILSLSSIEHKPQLSEDTSQDERAE